MSTSTLRGQGLEISFKFGGIGIFGRTERRVSENQGYNDSAAKSCICFLSRQWKILSEYPLHVIHFQSYRLRGKSTREASAEGCGLSMKI